MRYRFGRFTLDLASFRLECDSAEVPLTPKAFEILALLVRHRHRGLTKQELLEAVWPGIAVTENTLTQRIKEIRDALGDRVQDPIYIRTIPRVGFQFVGSVTEADTSPAPVEVGQAAPEPERQRVRRTFWVAGAVLAVAAVMAGAFVYSRRPGEPAASAMNPKARVMVAVLPFQNLSGDPEQAYISDGLTEEMISELGRLDPAHLGVIARTSSMTYKGTSKGVAEIARELGVDFVLEGSVRRESDRVRIVAQLIRASDQTPVWAERYDRDLRSFLSLQREVTGAIALQARLKLSAEAEARLGRALNVHPDAYQAYSKGRFLLHQRTPDSIRRARQHFEEAIATDPGYAQAHAGLADAHELLASYAGVPPREAQKRSMEHARRALELDAEMSEPYVSLGIGYANYTWDWARAEEAFIRALELNPSNALAHKGYSELLSVLARHDEAIAEAKRAVELDPLSLLAQANLGITYYRARRYDEAVQQLRQTLSLDPNYMLAHFDLGLVFAARGAYHEAIDALQRATTLAPDFDGAIALLGAAYVKTGRNAEARAIGERLQALSADRYVSGFVRGVYALSLGRREEALVELERAYDDRSWLVTLLKVDPTFDELRSHPRFQTLLARLKFPEVEPSTGAANTMTGTWDINARFSIEGGPGDGQSTDMKAILVLTEKDKTLTGTFTPYEAEGKTPQPSLPIVDGRVNGTRITFSVKQDDSSLAFDLVLADDQLRGSATPSKPVGGGGTLTITLTASRRK